jgi:hypothetical protein
MTTIPHGNLGQARFFKTFQFAHGTRIVPFADPSSALGMACGRAKLLKVTAFVWNDNPSDARLMGAYDADGHWRPESWARLQLLTIQADKAAPGLWKAVAGRLLKLPQQQEVSNPT